MELRLVLRMEWWRVHQTVWQMVTQKACLRAQQTERRTAQRMALQMA